MVNLKVHRVEWRGLPTGPGVSTFYADDAGIDIRPYLDSLFTAIGIKVPNVVSFYIPNSGITIDSATGHPNASWTAGSAITRVATGSGVYAAPVGGLIRWETPTFIAGRRLIGKTFMVPFLAGCFESNGTLLNTVKSDLEAAAALFVTGATSFRVYSRKNHVAASVATSSVPDKAMVLRSRRD